MSRTQLFYVFDEHTDYVKECKKMGLIPIVYRESFVEEFDLQGTKYKVLNRNDCYSGWEINIIPINNFAFFELLSIAINSKIYDERVVSIGLILKNYYSEFLDELKKDYFLHKSDRKQKKMIKLIYKEISQNSFQVNNMKELLFICESIIGKEK